MFRILHRPQRKICRVAVGFTMLALTALAGTALVGCQNASSGPADVATSSACLATPAAATNTSSGTLLGVNATNPGQLSSRTAQFGHIPILRVYYTGLPDPDLWTTGVQGLNRSAVVVSFRSPPSTVLSGADDATLARFFDSAPTGYPLYYSYYHEPELLVEAGTFTLAQYKAAWARIAAIADAAHNPYLKSTLILMSWDLNPASGINWKDYLPGGHVISVLGWDAYPAGTVHNSDPQPTPPTAFMWAAEAASRQVGLPFGFAEFALGTQTGRPQWLAEVASYLRQTKALFGILFDSTGYPWMELTDYASIRAWRAAVGCSTSGSAARVVHATDQAS
jgi:hypothetical protein